MPQNLNIQKLIVELPLFCQLVSKFRSVSQVWHTVTYFHADHKTQTIKAKLQTIKAKIITFIGKIYTFTSSSNLIE